MEEETKNKIKDYWKSRVYDHANKTAEEVKEYEEKIRKLREH